MALQPRVDSNELRALLRRVNNENPSQADRKALDAYIVEHGSAEFAAVANLARLVTDTTIKKAFGHDYGFSRAVEAKCVSLRDELGYEQAPALEKMLIQAVTICWLRLQICEFHYGVVIGGECTLIKGAYWEKKLSAHQRRYLRAVETLAKVRKLAINVQINVGQNQQVITR